MVTIKCKYAVGDIVWYWEGYSIDRTKIEEVRKNNDEIKYIVQNLCRNIFTGSGIPEEELFPTRKECEDYALSKLEIKQQKSEMKEPEKTYKKGDKFTCKDGSECMIAFLGKQNYKDDSGKICVVQTEEQKIDCSIANLGSCLRIEGDRITIKVEDIYNITEAELSQYKSWENLTLIEDDD